MNYTLPFYDEDQLSIIGGPVSGSAFGHFKIMSVEERDVDALDPSVKNKFGINNQTIKLEKKNGVVVEKTVASDL